MARTRNSRSVAYKARMEKPQSASPALSIPEDEWYVHTDTEEGEEKRSTECLVLLTRSGRVTYNAYVTIAESGRGKPLGANTLIVIIESFLRANIRMHGGVKGSARMPGPSPIRHPAPPS